MASIEQPQQYSQEKLHHLNKLKQEIQDLSDKATEIEIDLDEHRLVRAALEPLAPSRKCWRRVGGILVESTVGDTLPLIIQNATQMEKVCGELREALKKKDKEFDECGESN